MIGLTITTYMTGALQEFTIRRGLVEWADTIGPSMREELKRQAPVGLDEEGESGRRPGRLRDSITYRRESITDGVRVVWSAHIPYAEYVIHGTRGHEISAVAAKRLRFHGRDGDVAYRDHVSHPGARANDFPSRAYEHEGAALRTALQNAVVRRSE